jgi:hypothetical protein
MGDISREGAHWTAGLEHVEVSQDGDHVGLREAVKCGFDSGGVGIGDDGRSVVGSRTSLAGRGAALLTVEGAEVVEVGVSGARVLAARRAASLATRSVAAAQSAAARSAVALAEEEDF